MYHMVQVYLEEGRKYLPWILGLSKAPGSKGEAFGLLMWTQLFSVIFRVGVLLHYSLCCMTLGKRLEPLLLLVSPSEKD